MLSLVDLSPDTGQSRGSHCSSSCFANLYLGGSISYLNSRFQASAAPCQRSGICAAPCLRTLAAELCPAYWFASTSLAAGSLLSPSTEPPPPSFIVKAPRFSCGLLVHAETGYLGLPDQHPAACCSLGLLFVTYIRGLTNHSWLAALTGEWVWTCCRWCSPSLSFAAQAAAACVSKFIVSATPSSLFPASTALVASELVC